MDENISSFFCGVIVLCLFYFVGWLSAHITEDNIRQDAIRNGVAEWRTDANGEQYFVWKTVQLEIVSE
jgi:hypothetical protein